ncbi:unnamed protein product [Choristocarpus tenellus]
MDFFDLAQQRELDQALVKLEAAGLLPRSMEDVSQVAYRLRSMGIDDALRACLDQVMVAAMRCIRDRHVYAQQQMMASRAVDADEWKALATKVLEDLQLKAKLLVSLAGRLTRLLPEGTAGRLSRMETVMVT